MNRTKCIRFSFLAGFFAVVLGAVPVFAQEAAAEAVAEVPPDPRVELFDGFLKRAQRDPAGMTRDEMLQGMQLGMDLGRPSSVAAVAKFYLNQTPAPAPEIVLATARAADRAGDFRTAASRYKQYLGVAEPNEENSKVAARLFVVLIDLLASNDEAFRFMDEEGGKFRQSAEARKFDGWFVEMARQRRAYLPMARRLAAVMADGLPLAQERYAYWEPIDWLMREAGYSRAEMLDALPFLRQIVERLRDNPARKARYHYIVTHLAFRAAAVGKDADGVMKEFEPVVAAARAYIDARPTHEVFEEILRCWLGGPGQWDPTWYNRTPAQCRSVLAYAFERVSPEERRAMVDAYAPHGWLETTAGWQALAKRFPEAFKGTTGVSRLGLDGSIAGESFYRDFLPALEDAPSFLAAATHAAIAAKDGGDDLWKGVETVRDRYAWFLELRQERDTLWNAWSIYSRFERPEERQAAIQPQWQEVFARFCRERTLRSVALCERDIAREAFQTLWGTPGFPRQDFIGALGSLAWVPYSPDDRAYVLGGAYDHFQQWANGARQREADAKTADAAANEQIAQVRAQHDEAVRQQQANPDDAGAADRVKQLADQLQQLAARRDETAKAAEAALADSALVTPLEDAFRAAREARIDPSKAPDDLCRAFSQCAAAIAAKDQAAYVAAARDLYGRIRDFESSRVPFGHWLIRWLASNRFEAFDTLDFQLEMLADQLDLFRERGTGLGAHLVMQELCRGRGNWNGWCSARWDERPAVSKLCDTLAAANAALFSEGKFDRHFFQWFRHARTFEGGRVEHSWHPEVYEALIEKRLLRDHPEFRADGSSYTVTYQWLVRNECNVLEEKYPVQSWFDDMYAQELRERGMIFEYRFWDYSPDTGHKAADVASELLAAMDGYPYFGDDDICNRCDRNTYWNMLWRIHERSSPEARAARYSAALPKFGTTLFDSYSAGLHLIGGFDPADAGQRKACFDRIAAYTDRIAALPWRETPAYVGGVAAIPHQHAAQLTDEECDILLRVFLNPSYSWNGGWNTEHVDYLLQLALLSKKRWDDLFDVTPQCWRVFREHRHHHYWDAMANVGAAIADAGQAELATMHAGVGLNMIGNDLPEHIRNTMMAVRSKAMSGLGGAIPVERGDRRYPVFAAQADYLFGKLESAWAQYTPYRDLMRSIMKELDPGFVLWIIQRHTDVADYDIAEDIARDMLVWVKNSPQGFDKETRAALDLAYADIAKARQEYPKARAQYEQIALAREYDDTASQRAASLRVAEVDRLTRQYDAALDRLDKLSRRPDSILQAESFFQMALIHYDREEYADARDCLEKTFALMPGHTDARLLEGKLHLRMKKLVEATEVTVGTQGSQETLVPGKSLKVQIEDRTLAVVGQSSAIEVRAWASSGDEEIFNLLPFGDSKTKFEGHVATALGEPNPGDRILQVRGGDTVQYDFSDRFKEANKITESQITAIKVRSDADLFISSGRILSQEEQEQLALEQLVRDRLRVKGLDREGRSLSSVRKADEIKPGNPINVRVVDPDRSVNATPDRITVRVATSSGDRIDAFELVETGPDTGVFEGKIPTRSAPATAFASDTEEGRDPVNVIAAGDHEPWIGQPDNRRPKSFSVDLNKMVELGTLDITSAIAGRRPRRLLVQTSPSGKTFSTVGAWPENLPSTGTSPWFELVRFADRNHLANSLAEVRDYLDAGYAVHNAPKIQGPCALVSTNFDGSLNGAAQDLGLSAEGVNSWVVGRCSASFVLARRQVCVFRIDNLGRQHNIRYWLAIDGEGAEPHHRAEELTRTLGRGVHRVEVYFAAHRSAQPAFVLQSDVETPPEIRPCTADLFSGEANPELASEVFTPAGFEVSGDGDNLRVTFAPGTKARTLRLYFADFEGQAPAINRLVLTDAAGATLLPPDTDVLGLKRNDILEIVPGDDITVTYTDPTPLEKANTVREARMTATFRDAVITACVVDSWVNEHNVRQPVYIPLRRFTAGDAVAVFIEDPDCDETDQPDKVPFRVQCAGVLSDEIFALESEPHSGIFIGKVFPVFNEPTRPDEVRVEPEEDMTLIYLDEENTDPGIPWERRAIVEQVSAAPPEIRLYSSVSRALDDNELARVAAEDRRENLRDEVVPVTRTITALRPMRGYADNVSTTLVASPLFVEVTWPANAATAESELVAYAQTSSGRAMAGVPADSEDFDIRVPGTVRLYAFPGNVPGARPPVGYREIAIHGNPYAGDALDEGRYGYALPLRLAEVPANSPAVDQEKKVRAALRRTKDYLHPWNRWEINVGTEEQFLAVRGDDTVFVGIPYERSDGSKAWATREIRLASDPFLHIMDRRYQNLVTETHVGETLYMRVINQVLDVTDEKDAVTVSVAAASGATREYQLMETFAHSGVFKGSALLAFNGDAESLADPSAIPVAYGDTVSVAYVAPNTGETLSGSVALFKGSDGSVAPFTKQFKDPEIAIQTQFTMAEAYFEMAKKHRELGRRDVARKEIGQGRKLLEESLRDSPKSEARAHANYLLAELAMQFADETEDPQEKGRHFQDAVARFTDIVATYPDSPYAPKAQFKKALAYEKMGLIDQSCEEYVKLSYRYPDDELVAETIARLGQYFLNKNKTMVEEARAISDLVQRETQLAQARLVAKTAAQVFGRMHERFPDHALAWKTLVISGQCYIRAEDYERAVATFETVIEEKKADSDLRAQAMYWCGDAFMKAGDLLRAYRMFKNLTWNYPESVWAKYARGRLSEEALSRIETQEAGQ
ncbi:MAG: tetratricopeptide repeat protein [Kiritimatiellia bacterium]